MYAKGSPRLQYQLDNEIDFHNSAEPSTTSCPLLPGQLVNVLHMPFHLSNGHHKSRNGSVSSTSSDLRTMNPEDKFLNPRRAPIPKLPRLQTSPPLLQWSDSAASSPIGSVPSSAHSHRSNLGGSQPGSANGLRKFRLPRKPSVEGKSRSLSPPKASGKRAVLKQLISPRPLDSPADTRPGRKVSPPKENEKKFPLSLTSTTSGRIAKSSTSANSRNGSHPHSPQNLSRAPSTEQMLSKPLPLRHQPSGSSAEGEDRIPLASFQNHRRARSRSREPSPLRNSMLLANEESDQLRNLLNNVAQTRPLEPLVEAPSNQATPVWPVTARKVDETVPQAAKQHNLAEKRLPTLPNSPSSAYDPSFIENSPTKSLSEDLQHLESHFSNWTMTTSSGTSPQKQGPNHLSNCTYISASYSPSTNYQSVFNPQGPIAIGGIVNSPEQSQSSNHSSNPTSPIFSSKHTSVASENAYGLASESTCSSISTYESSLSSSPTSESFGLGLGFQSGRRNAGHFQGYQLPDDSEATIKQYPALGSNREPLTNVAMRRQESGKVTDRSNDLQHSSSMQKLIDELSYLGNMIQR